MKKILCTLVLTAVCLGASAPRADAVVLSLNLLGAGGAGLLTSNEVPVVVGTGSGDAIALSYDTDSNVLSLNLVWGSGNGFSDLTGAVSGAHIHGATAGPAPASFGQTAGFPANFNLITAPTVAVNTSATNGSAVGTITFLESQEAGLLEGRYYFNFHTATNGGGEIRGNIVPEPSRALLALIGLAPLALRRRRLS